MKHGFRDRGFTLVEIMVVVVILGLLAGLVVPNVIDSAERSRLEKARADVAELKHAVDAFILQTGASELPAWEVLIMPDARGSTWLPGYSRPPEDPWGHAYEIRPGEYGVRDYEVLSGGPDGVAGSEDDISSRTIRDSHR